MNEFLIWFVGIILFIAAIIDIKTREVPDFLSYTLIAVALASNAISSAAQLSFVPILGSLAGLLFAFCLGWALFYLGQWGGGDSKLIIGIGAAFGLPIITANSLNLDIISYLKSDIVALLSNMILVGALYAMMMAFILAFRNKDAVMKKTSELLKESRAWRIPFSAMLIVASVTIYFLTSGFERNLLIILLLLCAGFSYLWVFVKAVEETAMKKWVSPQKVTEGDWFAESVIVGKKTIVSNKDPGITKEQIKELMAAFKKGKIKKVKIKEGIPFVPNFFLSYLVTLFFGSLVFYFVLI